jgi:hypothetical protein
MDFKPIAFFLYIKGERASIWPIGMNISVHYRADHQYSQYNKPGDGHFPVFLLPHHPNQKYHQRYHKHQKENNSRIHHIPDK